MKTTGFNILCIFMLTLLSVATSAQNSHQYALGLGLSKSNYDDGESKSVGFSGSFFFHPIIKTDALPHSRTAFYSRTGNVSIATSKTDWKDLLIIHGGRVLKEADIQTYQLSSFIAYKDSPIWGGISYIEPEKLTRNFYDGSTDKTDLKNSKKFTIGYFINDHLSVYGHYAKEELDTYGIGLTQLFSLKDLGFLEINSEFKKTEKPKNQSPDIANNTIRNLDISNYETNNVTLQLTYFPLASSGVGILYHEAKLEPIDEYSIYYQLFAHHYITQNFRIGFSYFDFDDGDKNLDVNFDGLSLNLGFEF